MLLLTATPEQLGQASHFARLRLLDPSRFHSLEAFREEEQTYRHWSEIADRLQAGETNLKLPQGVDASAGVESCIDQILDRHGTGRVLFRNTRAAVPGFPERSPGSRPIGGRRSRTAGSRSTSDSPAWTWTRGSTGWKNC